jgi:ring-1,2-phenylacetyl-CoA epoxidase subunit PaaD
VNANARAEVPALDDVRRILADVPDPEIPAISIVDLGIVRDVAWRHESGGPVLHVTITPTYSGCPATRAIERDIVRALHDRGIERVALDVRLAPAWTTDWLGPAAREKLHAYGIAPPIGGAPGLTLDLTRVLAPMPACPRCDARDVTLTSAFGSTPCKSLYRCNVCREPFDYFKCH